MKMNHLSFGIPLLLVCYDCMRWENGIQSHTKPQPHIYTIHIRIQKCSTYMETWIFESERKMIISGFTIPRILLFLRWRRRRRPTWNELRILWAMYFMREGARCYSFVCQYVMVLSALKYQKRTNSNQHFAIILCHLHYPAKLMGYLHSIQNHFSHTEDEKKNTCNVCVEHAFPSSIIHHWFAAAASAAPVRKTKAKRNEWTHAVFGPGLKSM